VGKSHIAQALGYAACQKGFHVLYVKTGRLLQDLGGGHADGSWEARLRRYLAPDLLILDDFGIRGFSPTQAEDLFELICDRHQAGSMIVASNRTPQDWYGLFPNPVLAEGALDRLVNSAHHVLMPGRSYRPLRRPGREATKPPLGPGVPSSPHTPPEHEDDQGLAEGGGGMP
jgi:DNA replication protein DnaC